MRAFRLAKCQPLRVDVRLIKRMMYSYTPAEIEAKIAAIENMELRKEASRIHRLAYVG